MRRAVDPSSGKRASTSSDEVDLRDARAEWMDSTTMAVGRGVVTRVSIFGSTGSGGTWASAARATGAGRAVAARAGRRST